MKRWTKLFEDPCLDEAYSVQQTSDCGYIIVVERKNFLIKIKTDANRNKMWEKAIGKISTPFCTSMVKQTSNEGYTVLGHKEYDTWEETGFVEADIFLMKIDKTQTPRGPTE